MTTWIKLVRVGFQWLDDGIRKVSFYRKRDLCRSSPLSLGTAFPGRLETWLPVASHLSPTVQAFCAGFSDALPFFP